MAGETYTTKVPHVLSHSDNSLYSRYTYGDLRGRMYSTPAQGGGAPTPPGTS